MGQAERILFCIQHAKMLVDNLPILTRKNTPMLYLLQHNFLTFLSYSMNFTTKIGNVFRSGAIYRVGAACTALPPTR
ncbi:hypothetical protein KSF_071180 [Reticulibacter mediterranei]|uniref:Uncharacterized protein n=1 Tax=Reticulibacter mediterranei TaxID=2778369 RepID=A0A8J3IR98_9CHLR|nr:hypothetical protein KSF_071180 [Reticulibacter mediterranei]